jgi:hypothetical protein
VILDLLAHKFEKARELYGDRWLGLQKVICIAGSKRRVEEKSRSALSRAKNSRRIFRPFWRVAKSNDHQSGENPFALPGRAWQFIPDHTRHARFVANGFCHADTNNW